MEYENREFPESSENVSTVGFETVEAEEEENVSILPALCWGTVAAVCAAFAMAFCLSTFESVWVVVLILLSGGIVGGVVRMVGPRCSAPAGCIALVLTLFSFLLSDYLQLIYFASKDLGVSFSEVAGMFGIGDFLNAWGENMDVIYILCCLGAMFVAFKMGYNDPDDEKQSE